MSPAKHVALSLLGACLLSSAGLASTGKPSDAPTFQRLEHNPIVSLETHLGLNGNVNGPSLIKAPDWLTDAPGKYLLYFAHHDGRYIKLAYSDSIEGPWKLHEGGTLQIEQVKQLTSHHIASPDVIVDDTNQRIIMYFHFPVKLGSDGESRALAYASELYEQTVRKNDYISGQYTAAAVSTDGINFESASNVIAPFYLRVFKHRDQTYGIAKQGAKSGLLMQRSDDDLDTPFEVIKRILPRMRHAAVLTHENKLYLVFSRTRDKPERLLLTTTDMDGDPADWVFSKPIELLRPEHPWEGADLPLRASHMGYAKHPVNELRDPALFTEQDQVYLVYSIAGEQGLGIAKMSLHDFTSL